MLVLPLSAIASADSVVTVCPEVKIAAERLPDLNIPRNAHAIFCVNGEVTVVGGHTKSFVPTATAEYYKNGKWHLMETEYTHDNGVCVVLRSGKVLLAGGSAETMGVGQTYPVEEYDPATHTFRGFSCLSTKRTLAAGAELDSDRVMVTGNWYGDDGIEMFDGITKRQLHAFSLSFFSYASAIVMPQKPLRLQRHGCGASLFRWLWLLPLL